MSEPRWPWCSPTLATMNAVRAQWPPMAMRKAQIEASKMEAMLSWIEVSRWDDDGGAPEPAER